MAGHTRESLAFNHILQAMNIPCRILRDFRLMLAGNLFVTRCWVQPRNVQLLNLGDRSHRTVIDYCRLKLSTMFFPTVRFYRGTIPKSTCSSPSGTVDGQNPAPPRMMIIHRVLYIPWWLLGHQQYHKGALHSCHVFEQHLVATFHLKREVFPRGKNLKREDQKKRLRDKKPSNNVSQTVKHK